MSIKGRETTPFGKVGWVFPDKNREAKSLNNRTRKTHILETFKTKIRILLTRLNLIGLWIKFITFIALAEAIALLWAFIPFIILLAQQRSDPTNPQYIVDFVKLIPLFMWGQIPGMFFSGIIHVIFGSKSQSNF